MPRVYERTGHHLVVITPFCIPPQNALGAVNFDDPARSDASVSNRNRALKKLWEVVLAAEELGVLHKTSLRCVGCLEQWI
jgi:hypothetical protein